MSALGNFSDVKTAGGIIDIGLRGHLVSAHGSGFGAKMLQAAHRRTGN